MLNYIINNISKYNYSLYIPNQIKNNIYISITKIIPNSLINYNKIKDRYELLFNAENVINMKIFLIKNKILNHKQVILLIKSITKQIEILKNMNYSFLGFNINDILSFVFS